MSNDYVFEEETNYCGGSNEKLSLETPSSSVSYSVGQATSIGLPLQSDGITGVSITQSSPPHYRHSRAYRHFKNPPQPHMCIRTTTEHGEELFINVLSWTRIVIPQEASDPIPLYGGMRVPPGSARSPAVVFAVMANPEVLKDSGRHSKDPEERRAMVELMCDFVEAMNPGVKLIRNAVILKDRDISGELKDVWNAVQAQRDREREEQIIQQRQQQQYHNTTTQQLFPKTHIESQQTEHQTESTNLKIVLEDKTIYTDFGADSPLVKDFQPHDLLGKVTPDESNNKSEVVVVDSAFNCVTSDTSKDQFPHHISEQMSLEPVLIEVNNIHNSQQCSISNTDDSSKPNNLTNGGKKNSITDAIPSSTAAIKTPASVPTKKDKLGGFLPNGCIFPRFKNSKHKDKDKDNSKSTSKDREKNLLHVLKRNKDKQDDPTKSQYEQNCINLESEVEKLDLNKLDSAPSNDNIFMKLRVATSAAK